MDFKNVFIVMGISLVGIIAVFSFATDINTEYGTSIGYDMNQTRSYVQEGIIANLTKVSGETGTATEAQSGASAEAGIGDLIKRSLGVIGSIPRLLGMVPSLMSESASVIGIPSEYIDVATWLFIISFSIVLAYLFLTGARSLIG